MERHGPAGWFVRNWGVILGVIVLGLLGACVVAAAVYEYQNPIRRGPGGSCENPEVADTCEPPEGDLVP